MEPVLSEKKRQRTCLDNNKSIKHICTCAHTHTHSHTHTFTHIHLHTHSCTQIHIGKQGHAFWSADACNNHTGRYYGDKMANNLLTWAVNGHAAGHTNTPIPYPHPHAHCLSLLKQKKSNGGRKRQGQSGGNLNHSPCPHFPMMPQERDVPWRV